MPAVSNLTLGMNLWGYQGDVNMTPGQSLDCINVLFKPNGSIRRHHGYRRINDTALTAPGSGLKGFTYKGKNTPAAARPGNIGIADSGADFTRRAAFYSSGIVMTDTELRFWNPATQTLDLPVLYHAGAWLPAGVTVDPDPKPTCLVLQNNVYIVGWATTNIRYDPTDRVLYEWGWDSTPAAPVGAINGGGAQTLVANAVYRYRVAWLDLYTGEESTLSPELVVTTNAANRAVNFGAGAFAAYAGTRHFIGAGADQDVGLVVYRTDADEQTFHFPTTINPDGTPTPPVGAGPGLAACTMLDDGLATDYSIKADVRGYQDPPRLNTFVEFRNQWYGISWDHSFARVYWNDFRKVKSYYERWDVRNYREIPITEGETLMATAKNNKMIVLFSNIEAYALDTAPIGNKISVSIRPLNWGVGAVGPLAWEYTGSQLYWLSDRGPMRWGGSGPTQPLGDPVGPLFLDKGTSFCTMLETARSLSEVQWDQDADAVRFVFQCTGGVGLNQHLLFFPKTGGWAWGGTNIQAMTATNVFGEGLVGGFPVAPLDKRKRLVFIDDGNYICEYDPDNQRAGHAAAGGVVTGTAQAGSGVGLLITLGGLSVAGDGLAGLRLEIGYPDGTIDIRAVAAGNTAVNIVPTVPFTQDPTDALWFVAGYESYWQSWADHGGMPEAPKTLMHLFTGYNQEFGATGNHLILTVGAGDFPAATDRTRLADLSFYRRKHMISLTGRFFFYKVEGSRPDQPWSLNYLDPELVPVEARFP